MTTAKLLSALLYLESSARTTASAAAVADRSLGSNAPPSPPNRRFLSRDRFSRILHTALDDEATLQHLRADDATIEDDNHRQLQGMPSREVVFREHDDAWAKMARHGWDWGKRPHRRNRQRRNLRSGEAAESEGAANSPFVVCSGAPGRSGYERRQAISVSLDVPMSHAQTVYNTEDESCFIITSTAHDMESYDAQIVQSEFDMDAPNATHAQDLVYGPLVDVLKLPAGTAMGILENDDWAPPTIGSVADLAALSKRTYQNEFSYDNSTEEYDVDIRRWSRTILVDLLPGTVTDGDGIASVAEEILEYVEDMAMVPPDAGSSSLRGSNGGSNDDVSLRFAADATISTREAFSLTASSSSDDDDDENMRTFQNRHNIWSNALANGFEAPHGCQVMLDTLTITPRVGQDDINEDVESPLIAGFEIKLHPPSQFMKRAAVESSAWNKHCVLSLMIGLAVHPSVQTVEEGHSLELAMMSMSMPSMDDRPTADRPAAGPASGDMAELDLEQHSQRKTSGITNPQWIVQSGKRNSRPFFDVGLDGSGQTVAVADGGLDRDNCYFRDASPSSGIFGNKGWDMNQRKIVHYDDSFGDRTERSMGHGTYVSGILAGKRSPNGRNEQEGHADGTAPGAHLAFFDMEDAYFGISDPGGNRLLKSLYNPNGGNKGARVINASWGRSYSGQYTAFCREYDAALRNQYQDMLFVVSAGNTGRSGAYSIQDPADCKSPLAVGASMSSGTDSRDGELGIEHLADYSSRGPAQDGRIKPDIVAPGHFILAPRAIPSTEGECDGDREPNVKTGVPGGDGAKYTTGTSMAAPALAGGAALLRQYFEEGYCSSNGRCCGQQGCGRYMNPSGSLVKAVLMNGAQPLRGGIQFVPSGPVLDDQPLRAYDSNQGFGRVNLLNSVPLRGQNTMDMMVVNDKELVNGQKDVYTVYVDKSNGCSRPLSVTLAWYDAPGAIGCANCLVNDCDLSVKTSSGTKHPNGRRSRDSKNTVERVRTSVKHGEQVRIFVEAKNFAQYSQKYSLAITGCFEGNAAHVQARAADAPEEATKPTKRPTKQPTQQSGSSCPTSRLFQLKLNTANDGNDLTWSLIGSTSGGSPHTILHGPKGSPYANNREYNFSACLDVNQRYRFQLRNKSGVPIRSTYKIAYGGALRFNAASGGSLGKTSNYRFKTNGSGGYQQLGSNAFATHVQFGDEAEISAAEMIGVSSSYDSRDGGEGKMAAGGEGSYDESSDSADQFLTPNAAADEDESTVILGDSLDAEDEGEDEEQQQEFGVIYDSVGGEFIDVEHTPNEQLASSEFDDGEGEEETGEPLLFNTPPGSSEEETDIMQDESEGEAIVNEDVAEFEVDDEDSEKESV